MNGTENLVGSDGAACAAIRVQFSPYLDGVLDGRSMGLLADHLAGCIHCASEFEAWKSLQEALCALGPASLPSTLQDQLRDTLAGEIGTGRHLAPQKRLGNFLRNTIAPTCARLGAGLAAAVVLLISGAWVIGTAIPVQANDDRLAHMNAPRYLYSQVPPVAINSRHSFAAIMVDAKIDARGRVYDYQILEGPADATTRLQIERNLVSGVFQPATVFGEPVPGHLMMTYTTISVRG